MNEQKIKISKLYYGVDGSKEPFELQYSFSDFEDLPFTGAIQIKGELMRVEEGIMLLIQEIEATQNGNCARCDKKLKQKLKFHPSEWLYYEEKPDKDDASNEQLFLDKHQMEIDPFEPVRQELLLNLDPALHCSENCAVFEEPKKGVKALSKLKDLL
jgi:uncharacterized metal-binding protein YceD (DUF177 family)